MKNISLLPIRIKSGSTRIATGAIGLLAAFSFAAQAQKAAVEPSTSSEASSKSFLNDWWYGKYATGNWFGVRDVLKENGLTINGKYSGGFFGVVDSQGGAKGFYDQELVFGADLNFGKLLKVDSLEGLKMESVVRWRDSSYNANPNNYVKAYSMFNPSPWVSGMEWRFQSAVLEYSSTDMLPVKNMLEIRAGWIRPSAEFIDQPLSKLFMNNAITSAKGIGGNIPFSTSFSTWGGTLRVKPTDATYVKGGLFMSYPQATANGNHGLAFSGYGPNSNKNNLFGMMEAGWTPKFGASELPGKYAMGGYYYGAQKASFNLTPNFGQYGLYWQADQMLFREASPVVEAPAPMGKGATASSGKSFKAPVSTEKPKLSKQGLSMFNLISWAPSYNNMVPFYYQGGFGYTGAIPTRDKDIAYIGMALGTYSYDNLVSTRQRTRPGRTPSLAEATIALECGYRIIINDWAFVAPFAEYIIDPNGTGNVANALVLGTNFSVAF